jgi:1-acyl-sn-glycerol-3-phosphate acyltransferase
VFVAGTRIVVHAAQPPSAGSAYVVVSNHRSNWDPPVLVAGLPELISRFVVKEELMKIPVFGVALRKTGNLVVVRDRGSNDARAIRDGMSGRPPEVSMLFFAEGRRYDDDGIHPFKVGAFATAIGAGLPILPVAIAGSDRVFPNGRLLLRRGPVVVAVGEAIDVADYQHEDRQRLRDETRAAVSALYERARTRLAELD